MTQDADGTDAYDAERNDVSEREESGVELFRRQLAGYHTARCPASLVHHRPVPAAVQPIGAAVQPSRDPQIALLEAI